MAASSWVNGSVTGGAVVTRGVVSWIPACSGVQYGDISFSRSQGFDLTTAEYIKDVRGCWGLVVTVHGGLRGAGLRRGKHRQVMCGRASAGVRRLRAHRTSRARPARRS